MQGRSWISAQDDEALALRATLGDRAATAEIVRRHRVGLEVYCRSILRDGEDARDAAQETLASAVRTLPSRDPGRPLRPWLFRIARNASIDILRRRRIHECLDDHDGPLTAGADTVCENRVRLADLVGDLRALPERQRQAMIMHAAGGLPYEEIARTLQLSVPMARRVVFDARVALRLAATGRDAPDDVPPRGGNVQVSSG